jgi:hypothetical protein
VSPTLKVMWHIPLPLRQYYHAKHSPKASSGAKHAGHEVN